eukprot:scaffold3920_cov76-Cylindrotheca_fusiformis.AAC.1
MPSMVISIHSLASPNLPRSERNAANRKVTSRTDFIFVFSYDQTSFMEGWNERLPRRTATLAIGSHHLA